MKYCPNCQTRYTDEMLRFCLQDGTPLAAESEESLPTIAFGENRTGFTPKQVEPINPSTETSAQDWQQSQITHVSPPPAAQPKKTRTFLLVLLTGLVTLMLLGAGGLGAWLYLRNNRNEIAANTVSSNQAANTNSNTKSNAKTSPSPTATPKNQTNSSEINAYQNDYKTPAPLIDREQVKREVSQQITAWKSSAESRNLNAYMNNYADTVDYYNKRAASAAFVRGDKQRAFSKFDSIEINLGNISVTPDETGERATAVFDKEWVFQGEESYSAGKVKTQLQLRKINGQWLITGERDLKVYYTE